jgi:transposase
LAETEDPRTVHGKIRGRRTPKIHVVAHGDGRLIAFKLTGGNRYDIKPTQGLIEPGLVAKSMRMDVAYDDEAFRKLLVARATRPLIIRHPTRKREYPFDKDVYRERNVLGRALSATRMSLLRF